MGTLPPPTEYFPGIIFNEAYYKAANFIVTKEYIDNNFLKSVGYAYSRAIFTNFSGLVYAIGGISTSDITATGTITAAFFTGSGANLTNLNASNITDGTLSVSRGGTGLNTIPLGSLLIGNGANTLLQTTNLSWDNTNSILNATNFSGSHSGSGAGLINLNVSNANAGTLPIGRGGTGATSFIGGRLLYGDGVNPLAQSANLTWNNTNNTLNTTNVNSSAYFINGSPFTPYTLPTANAATLGGIKVGNNLSIDGNGVLSATSSGLTGADIFLDGGVNNRAYGWTGATSLLGRVGTAGAYSLNSLAEDVILRSQGRILLQSGTNVPGVTIETTTNNVIIRNSLGIGITTFGAGDILDVGGVFKVAFNGVAESITIRSTGINVNNTLNVSSGTNNGGIIRFGGFSDDTSLDLATIQNRQYATNKSELLLFKGDNIEGLTGADRIRLRAAAIAFDTFSTDVTTSATTENIRMYIDNSGSVGIGTTTPLSSYLLDVRGNIVSTGNIALVNASRSIFWTGTNSNLARAGVAGEYSTSAAINDIVLRSGNNLILQSGTGASAMFINTSNNVGIGTNGPLTLLDVSGNLLVRAYGTTGSGTRGLFFRSDHITTNLQYNCSILTFDHSGGGPTDGLSINGYSGVSFCTGANTRQERMRIASNGVVTIGSINGSASEIKLQVYSSDANGTCAIFKHPNDTQGIGIKFNEIYGTNTNQNIILTTTGTGLIIFNTGNNERMRVASNGYVGIGASPSYKMHVKVNYDSVGTGLHLDADDSGGFSPDKYALTIWAYVIGGGQVGWRFRTQSLSGGNNTPLTFTHDGTIRFQSYRWHSDDSGYARFYYAPNATTYLRGHGSTVLEYRNGGDSTIAVMASTGQFACHFLSISNSGTDYIGVNSNTALGSLNYQYMHIMYGSFTGYHRCYYEDDEIYNNNMTNEEIDIFKNNYKGRIVISTGKIKTDFSRELPKEEEEIDESIKSTNYEEIKKANNNVEWYSIIDKDGICIEDALPVVQLSNIKKDKRVYGVLGNPDRKTNNKNRLIVNSIGEGAICVCNKNGNIENGDYIHTSDLLGYGEKQDDDLLHNYTVAKAVIDCNFELNSPYYQCYEIENGIRVAYIACTYHCG